MKGRRIPGESDVANRTGMTLLEAAIIVVLLVAAGCAAVAQARAPRDVNREVIAEYDVIGISSDPRYFVCRWRVGPLAKAVNAVLRRAPSDLEFKIWNSRSVFD